MDYRLWRKFLMEKLLNKEVTSVIEEAKSYCNSEGLVLELTYSLPPALIKEISDRSKALPSLYFASVEMINQRLENGCFILKKKEEVVGHIFAHKHEIRGHAVYERASLWVKKEYRNFNLGLLLMSSLTNLYKDEFVISIASEPIVHNNNKLLGMEFVTLSEMSNMLVETLEQIGKLRDELKYKYYVNPYFKSKIGTLDKK